MTTDSGPEDRVFSLVYVGSATLPFSPREDLRAPLTTCRKNNAELSVTGLLPDKDGNFMQLLEGDEETVRGFYVRIENAPHSGEINLQQGFVEGRQFPDWSMGFRDLDSPKERSTPGYSEF